MTARRVLLLLDAATLPHLHDGAPPGAPFSHDKNLFQFAHEALRRGWRVMLSIAQAEAATRPAWAIEQVFPTWQQGHEKVAPADIAPDMVVSVLPETLNVRAVYPRAKIVAIHAAIHWVETPDLYPAQYVFDLITAMRYNIDFVLTQNARMAELLHVFYAFLSRWQLRDRIIVAPLGVVEEERHSLPDRAATRMRMGLGPDEVAIINSGGIWSWTDFNTFLRAFGEHVGGRPDTNLRLFVMGLLQPTNIDHGPTVAETEALLFQHRHLLGSHVTVHNEWDDASRRVRAYTAASDLGLNVNRPTLENWQSYRMRMLDYMGAGLPVIQTRGDILAETDGGAHAFLVDAGDQRGYRAALDAIADDPSQLAGKAAGMRALARGFDSRATYGAALDQIERTPRRRHDDHAEWGDCVLDYAGAHIRAELRGRLRRGVDRLADQLLD